MKLRLFLLALIAAGLFGHVQGNGAFNGGTILAVISALVLLWQYESETADELED